MKIGFIDYFLDNWHANNYPAWFAEQAAAMGLEASVAYAWAQTEPEGMITTASWCQTHGVTRCGSVEELIERSDALVLLSPNHSEQHEQLAHAPLACGKPIYIDKTFSPDLASGRRMFDRAQAFHTPLCSSSALRFSVELPALCEKRVSFLSTTGPGKFAEYAVHQAEMIVAVLGESPKRVLAVQAGNARQLLIDYGDAQASMLQMPPLPFTCAATFSDGTAVQTGCSDFFPSLIAQILRFFASGETFVSRAQTLAVMAILEAGAQALGAAGTWVPVCADR